ncbi:MAG TPA: four helix bundle protein [Bacteroidales bacterium]|nr:four helix bundle protein [Bacteroidales bacterium]
MTHKNLIVWQKSIDLVEKIYNHTDSYPNEELYGLTSQMRRASVSIPSNIAEGHGRYSQKELVRFLFISLGSASELETQIIISKRIRFINEDVYNELNNLVLEIIKMLSSLIKSKNNGTLINPDDEPITNKN